ncbi:MAG: pseudouridine synthase [Terracidiphilus sp.]|jgi:23S rRNA pseudouridine2605 synthase
MKKELKSKAKSPAAKRAPKSTAKSARTADASKVVVASKATSTKTKTATVKAKTPAAQTKATKAKPAEKLDAKRKKPAAKSKTPATKTRKRAAKAEAATEVRIGEPVLDPIGDVISGEARTYLGKGGGSGKAEIDASGAEAETEAADGTQEAGPGMAAATGAANGAEEEAAEGETGVAERPPAKLERLQKILSQAGIASRRHAEEMIVAGRVMVNGQVVTQLGSKADAGRDHIRVDGKLLQGAERHRYFVLNKPKGYVTTVSDPEGRPTVMEFFSKTNERLYPVGRLDYQSEGLLLMTNDGELANLLSKAGSGVEKVYLVKVAGQPSEDELERLRGGVAIERGEAGSERVRTAPARIRQVRVGENPWYEVVLTEGRNRELRKMFAAIGHFAEKIRRVGYGPLVLDVEPGKLRELTADEVNALRLTAEGKMKPRRMRVDISLPKEAGRAPAKRGEKPAWRDKPIGKRGDREQRGARGAAPERGERPFGQREERGPRTEWKPREQTFGGASARGAGQSGERPRFDKRAGGPPRAGSGFGARPGFGGGREERKPFRREEKTGFGERAGGPPRASSGFDKRGGKPFGARPAFGGGREGGAGRSGEQGAERGDRKEWKPREQAAGGFENAPRKPFRAQGERPAFVRPEGSFARTGGPKKRFEGGHGKGFGGGSRDKKRWTPRPDRARSGEGRGQSSSGDRPAPPSGEKRWEGKGAAAGTGRPKPAFGARPGGFKRPGKPGGFARPGGFSKLGRPGGGASRGGSRPGGRPHGGQKQG